MRAKYHEYISFKKDIATSDLLNDEQYMEYISLLIFIGNDGRLWCKHGYTRVYFDRLNKYYDLKKKKWMDK